MNTIMLKKIIVTFTLGIILMGCSQSTSIWHTISNEKGSIDINVRN